MLNVLNFYMKLNRELVMSAKNILTLLEEKKISNFKIFPGTNREVSRDKLIDQINNAINEFVDQEIQKSQD